MKKISFLIITLQIASVNFLFAGTKNDTTNVKTSDIQKSYFYRAKQEIEEMLSGKKPLNYERAVFITENAWYENEVSYTNYSKILDFYTQAISSLVKANDKSDEQNFKSTFLKTEKFQKEEYNKALTNWAISRVITDTTFLYYKNIGIVFSPMNYSYTDPYATADWKNSQVIHLLEQANNSGNCYALTSLFKILSLRLNSDANLVTAPNHIYIEHKDNKGTRYNVELASKAFPGFGSLQTLTYTTDEAIKSGIAFRTLDLKQSVLLSLVYLAKGYENKFNVKDDFVLSCANLALKNDSLNLNAMLLKAELLEERIVKRGKTIAQLQTDKDFQEYQKFIAHLYQLGYREMPLEMKNILVSTIRKDTVPLILKDHTPQPFSSLGVKTTRYATLSNGLFEEVHKTKSIEKINQTIFDTKTQKIKAFEKPDALYNNYNFDPVVFALSVDPLAKKYPGLSPYNFVGNSPLIAVDMDGADIVVFNQAGREIFRKVTNEKFETYVFDKYGKLAQAPMPKIIQSKDGSNTTTPKFQKYDYMIAAQTFLFNERKNDEQFYTDGNKKIPKSANANIPDLDPTLVKAVVMQESAMGTGRKDDIMTANAKGDWGPWKSNYGLKEGGTTDPATSVKAGIMEMTTKGFKAQGSSYIWESSTTWSDAAGKYNGGGTAGYKADVDKMVTESQEGCAENYVAPTTTPQKK